MREEQPREIRHLRPVVPAAEVEGVAGAEASADATRPLPPLGWEQVVEASAAPLRAAVARLEAQRAADEETVRQVVERWATEVAELRARIDGAEARADVQRAGLEALIAEVEQQLARMRAAAERAEQHEAMIEQLRDEHVHGAASLQRINQEQILILNQLLGRISGIQTELVQQRARIRGLLIAVGSTALAVAALVGLLVLLYLT